jgi:hypothetical protein
VPVAAYARPTPPKLSGRVAAPTGVSGSSTQPVAGSDRGKGCGRGAIRRWLAWGQLELARLRADPQQLELWQQTAGGGVATWLQVGGDCVATSGGSVRTGMGVQFSLRARSPAANRSPAVAGVRGWGWRRGRGRGGRDPLTGHHAARAPALPAVSTTGSRDGTGPRPARTPRSRMARAIEA